MDRKHRNHCSLCASIGAFVCQLGERLLWNRDNWLPYCNWMALDSCSHGNDACRSFRISHSVPPLIRVSRLSSFEVRIFGNFLELNKNLTFVRFNGNYGAIGMMDYLFGTDKSFRKTINDTRHRTLFSLKSARERFPDPPTRKND